MKIRKTLIASVCLALVFAAACRSMNTETPGTAALEAPTVSDTPMLTPTPLPTYIPVETPEIEKPTQIMSAETPEIEKPTTLAIQPFEDGWASVVSVDGQYNHGFSKKDVIKKFEISLKKILRDNTECFEVVQLSGDWSCYPIILSNGLNIWGEIYLADPLSNFRSLFSLNNYDNDDGPNDDSVPDTKENRIAISRYFRYYINDELILCKFESMTRKNDAYHSFIFDKHYPLDQIDTIRIELYDHGSPVE